MVQAPVNFDIQLPDTDSLPFDLLLFIGQNRGVTTTQVERCLVERLLNQQWDPKKRAKAWMGLLYGKKQPPMPGIFRKYCVKFEKLWFLTEQTATAMNKLPGIKVIHRRVIAPLAAVPPVRDLHNGADEIIPKFLEPKSPPVHIPVADQYLLEIDQRAAIEDLRNIRALLKTAEANYHAANAVLQEATSKFNQAKELFHAYQLDERHAADKVKSSFGI